MPYEFHEWEQELEPQAASVRMGGPPRKTAGIGILDPPEPPRKSPEPLAALPYSFLMRFLAGLILAGFGLFLLYLLFAR